jgi:hypothetical protein
MSEKNSAMPPKEVLISFGLVILVFIIYSYFSSKFQKNLSLPESWQEFFVYSNFYPLLVICAFICFLLPFYHDFNLSDLGKLGLICTGVYLVVYLVCLIISGFSAKEAIQGHSALKQFSEKTGWQFTNDQGIQIRGEAVVRNVATRGNLSLAIGIQELRTEGSYRVVLYAVKQMKSPPELLGSYIFNDLEKTYQFFAPNSWKFEGKRSNTEQVQRLRAALKS